MADHNNSKGDFVVGLLVGGALGAALALLYAPQSGDETRDTIRRRGLELKDSAADVYDQVKGQTTAIASQVKDSTTTLAGTVRESASHVASSVGETLSRVKTDVAEGVASVKATSAQEAAAIAEAARSEAARVREMTSAGNGTEGGDISSSDTVSGTASSADPAAASGEGTPT